MDSLSLNGNDAALYREGKVLGQSYLGDGQLKGQMANSTSSSVTRNPSNRALNFISASETDNVFILTSIQVDLNLDHLECL